MHEHGGNLPTLAVHGVVQEPSGSIRMLCIQRILNVVGGIRAPGFLPLHSLEAEPCRSEPPMTAPILMMSPNRQAEIDRRKAQIGHRLNIEAGLEIEQLHQKIDLFREHEVTQLHQFVELLPQRLNSAERREAP